MIDTKIFPNLNTLNTFEEHIVLDCFKRSKVAINEIWQAALSALREIEPLVHKLTDIDTGYNIASYIQFVFEIRYHLEFYKEYDLPMLVHNENLTQTVRSSEMKSVMQFLSTRFLHNVLYNVQAVTAHLNRIYPLIEKAFEKKQAPTCAPEARRVLL